jgi:hypothetical protein
MPVASRAGASKLVLAAACASLVVNGCGACRDKPQGAAGSAKATAKGPAQKAVVEGVVRFADGFELPSYPPEQMTKKLLKQLPPEAPPAACTPPKTTDRQPVTLTPDGLLGGVMLAASNFSHQPNRPPLVHEVTIEDCRLKPSLVVAMKGDSLRVQSTVNYPFMPSYNEGSSVRSLIPGQTYDVVLDKPGVAPLFCGFTASCGRTDVIVMLHPVYTTTDASGKFRFDDFPAGENVSLSAWHPLFQEAKIDLRVEPGEHKTVELVLKPNAQAPKAGDSAQAPADRKEAVPSAAKTAP